MRHIKVLIAFLIDATIKRRWPIADTAYIFARRVISAYENNDVNMVSNGERWLVQRLAARGSLVAIDVGANQGDWAQIVLEYSPQARLLCFEPVPATFAVLKQAITGPNVSLYNLALSSLSEPITIHAVDDNPYIASVCAGELYEPELQRNSITVQTLTGNQILKDEELENVNFLKIDAEGHDFNILQGFAEAIEKNYIELIQFEYNIFTLEAGHSLSKFFKLLGQKYILCRLLPNGLEACGYHPVLDNFGQSNWVAVRTDTIDENQVEHLAIRIARGSPGDALKKQIGNDPRLASLLC
jgi:FkbM family methyltransferase